MDDWWVYDAIDTYAKHHSVNLDGLKEYIQTKTEERTSSTHIKKLMPGDVATIHHRHDGWEVAMRDGSVHIAEVVLCAEDSVAAFSLE